MPRPARIVVKGLGCNHHRLAMIWAIKSSRDFARRGALGFTTAFTGTALASCGAPAGFSSNAGITRSALCVGGGSAAFLTGAGAGVRDGTPSDVLGGAVGGGASATATTAAVSSGTDGGGGAGGAGRNGMSATVMWSCLVE